jgi:hypothetical protein
MTTQRKMTPDGLRDRDHKLLSAWYDIGRDHGSEQLDECSSCRYGGVYRISEGRIVPKSRFSPCD